MMFVIDLQYKYAFYKKKELTNSSSFSSRRTRLTNISSDAD